jgi:hypothetical protein
MIDNWEFTHQEGNIIGTIQHHAAIHSRTSKKCREFTLKTYDDFLNPESTRIRPEVKLMVKYMLGVRVKGLPKHLKELADRLLVVAEKNAELAAKRRNWKEKLLEREARRLGYKVVKNVPKKRVA